MTKPRYLKPLDDHKAFTTRRDCLCSNCWGHLNLHFAPDRKYWVKCHQCGDETRGYIRKAAVELRKQEDHFNAQEVARAYPGLAGKSEPNKSSDETIDELGF